MAMLEHGGAAAEVRCVDFWCNEFGMRARIALREKRVGFELVEEDLRVRERSDLVRRMNPVYQSVPILIHDGRPVCGSMNIVEYVDAVYPTQTRFFTSRGEEEKAAAMAELMGHLRRMEGVLGDGAFFGGDEFGLLDVAFVPFSSMFYGYEQHGGVDMEAECLVLMRWVRRCEERESVRGVLPSGKDIFPLKTLSLSLIPFSSMFHGHEQHGGFSFDTECPTLMRWVRRCRDRESVKSVLPDEVQMYKLYKEWYGIE
ncbi:hypothetical protein PR202_ga28353 [Eleusine coracana subsp. coracana]|uniref:glutathione transferase n=1 Tax=Eleusine coracana subsp. coracana TaxID=191504 RepID=A0AAV5DGW1_ELECO|nr:hypothetical protein QOZ80_7AG0555760 [Eleusine coracana subsp. coracana]GJN10274.1 hypothetical protein PR202_ga28353 [Eleusine coracana subsp. coracana]